MRTMTFQSLLLPVALLLPSFSLIRAAAPATPGDEAARCYTFVYTSDLHYGITRPFRGEEKAGADRVNARMIDAFNALPALTLPDDGGAGARQPVRVDFVVQTGDISCRNERSGIASATEAGSRFFADYDRRLQLRDSLGRPVPVFHQVGNHDLSNAIGHARIPANRRDPWVMCEVYNRMMQPPVPLTPASFDYRRHRVNYSRVVGGVQLVFTQLWPDSVNRAWLDTTIRRDLPVLLFTHDQPDVEAKHLLDPATVAGDSLRFAGGFENLVSDRALPGTSPKGDTAAAQRALAAFVRRHPNLVAYFHGNDNHNEFYTYAGPDGDLALPVIRVDSPLKGNRSDSDESLLSFQLVTFDAAHRRLTVREVLWNCGPVPLFGESVTLTY